MSVSEFVIVAPLLSLFSLAAYDLNKRAEDAQNTLLVSRNAVYLGDVGSDGSYARASALGSLTQYDANLKRDRGMSGLVESAERGELKIDPSKTSPEENPTKSGTLLSVESLRKFSDAENALTAQPKGLKPVAGKFASGYNVATGAISGALPFVDGATQIYASVFNITGFDPSKNIRAATFDMKLSGARNALSRSMGALSDMVGRTRTAPLDRQFSSRFYVLGQSAFHTNDYRTSALVGAGLGALLKTQWGSESDFDSGSSKLQTRCMSRLTAEDKCETDDDYDDRREFHKAIKTLADAKLALSTVLTLGTFGIGEAVDIAISEAISEGVDAAVHEVASKASEAGKKMITDYVGDQVGGLEDKLTNQTQSKMTDFTKSFVPDFDLASKAVGE